MQAEPHRARDFAESFGADPERYDRTRPRYPQALVDRILASSPGPGSGPTAGSDPTSSPDPTAGSTLIPGPGPHVLDVGIGTGISAEPFRAAGCRVAGVEVDPRMAAFARRLGFEVEVGRFEDWDPAGRAFDLVVAGQAWHWVDPVAGAAKAADLLRPGGRLATFWNAQQPPPELAQALTDVYRRVLPGTPFAAADNAHDREPYDRILAATADGIRAAGAFAEPERWRFDWEQPYTRDAWLEQVPTFGGVSRLPPATLDELLTGIGTAIDALGGRFTMGYAVVAVTATRTRHTKPR